MSRMTDLLWVLVFLANVWFLASSRLNACIRIVAAQGILVGLCTVAAGGAEAGGAAALLGAVIVAVKGWLIPRLLFRALREAGVRREVEPYVGTGVSLGAGLAALGVGLWIAGRLPLPAAAGSRLAVPITLATLFTGLFIVITRRKALSQVLGFVVFENGIYGLGVALLADQPLVVEVAVLLDVFVAVFVMGIAVFHISREFDHIDTDRLDQLADWQGADGEGEP